MEPTPAEIADFINADSVADWADIPHHADPTSPRGALFDTFGITEHTHIRVLAAIPESVWMHAIYSEWKVDGHTPSLALRSKGGLMGAAARIAMGVQERADDVRKRTLEAIEVQRLQATAFATNARNAAEPPRKRVKLATVADQANDTECDELSAQMIGKAYEAFTKATGGQPAPHEELTSEQLAALNALLRGTGPPYVDFSVWGPFGHRIAKRVKLSGMVMKPGGELAPVELFGPENYEQWEACFRVWRTGCLMLEAFTLSTLEAYKDLISLYARRYGPGAWAIIYQTDVRCRLEHLDRMRRRAREDPTSGDGPEYSRFTEERPWEYCLRLAIKDFAFWHTELEEPARMVATRMARPASILGNDALIGNSLGLHSAATAPAGQGNSGQWLTMPTFGGAGSDWQAKKAKKVYNVDQATGMHTTNRKNKPLCEAWQSGSCAYFGGSSSCPANPSQQHQCSICLSTIHGAQACPRNPAAAQHTGGGKGRGKGKKGGGKKGGGKKGGGGSWFQ